MASNFVRLPPRGGGAAPVTSVFGRIGAVVGQLGDYIGSIIGFTPSGSIAAANLQAALEELDAEKQAIVAGVSDTEIGYLSNVTSDIQAQIDAKQVVVAGVSDAEIGYLSNVTSDIQAQIDTKQATITGAATTVVSSDLTTNRAVISNGSGKLDVSTVTSTELGYLSGTTSSVQTQLGALDTRLDALELLPWSTVNKATMYASTPADGTIVRCSDYNTHMQYSGGRWIPFQSIDPRYGFELYDDFPTTATTFILNWGIAATITTASATATHPGIAVVRQAAASSRAAMQLLTNGWLLGTMDVYQEWYVNIPTLATVGEDFSVSIGFNDAGGFVSGSLGVDMAAFVYNRGVNGANWICVTSSNSVATGTNTNTSTAITAGTWYRLGILIKTNASAEYYVDGVLVATHNSNIPTGAGRGTQYMARVDKIAGSANSDLQIDVFKTHGFFNGARVS